MWELDISRDRGKTWQTVAQKAQAESCKDTARKYHRTSTSVNPDLCYRIYSTLGQEQLVYVSYDNHSWRMVWHWGNQRSRAEQEGVVAPAATSETAHG